MRQFLSTQRNWPQPNAVLWETPTALHFPYQAQDRKAAVKALWRGVVLPSWQAKSQGSRYRKDWSTGFIHGTSGVGKTRFNHEFLGLLDEFLTPDSSLGHRASNEVESLQAALKNSKTVVIDLQHNGHELQEDEAKWPPEVILGLRLAHKYWFPHVAYSDVRDAFKSQVTQDSSIWATFKLWSVLKAIEQYKAAPTQADPSPRIPSVLHIAIDEIQTAFGFMVPERGHGPRLEPLSRAFNRALQSVLSQSRRIYVMGTLSGTAARHYSEVMEAMDASTVSVLLSPLSAESIRQIVASFQIRTNIAGQPVTVSGQEWLDKGAKPFERLLATTGGNPRILECLERALQDAGPPSRSIRLDKISAKLTEEVTHTFDIEIWGRQEGAGVFGLLLALAGIPVTRESVVGFEKKPDDPQQQQQQGRPPITVADLERAGVVHLRPPPRSYSDHHQTAADRWVNTWDVEGYSVMEVPFVLAKAALALVGKHDDELLADARRLLDDFYPCAASFSKLALGHRVLRHNVASEWARRQGRAYVEASDLFCGTICHRSLTKLRFVPAASVRHVSESRAAARSDNAVDGLLNEQLSPSPNKAAANVACAQQNVRVYIDAKHAMIGGPTTTTDDNALSYSDDIAALINKRRFLAHQFPNEEHIMVITSNKRAQPSTGCDPHTTAASLLRIPGGGGDEAATDPRTCIITASDDSLAWAMAPTFARFLL